MVDTIIGERQFFPIPETPQVLVLFIWIGVLTLLFFKVNPKWSSVIFLFAGLSIMVAGVVLFDRNITFKIARFLRSLIMICPSALIARYILERKQKLVLYSAFQHYVSGEVVKEVMNNPEILKLGGKQKEVTILFSDIAGFTDISETTPPETLVSWLNEYLDEMGAIVIKNQGTIDKYIGDAIMAFWNAPLEVAEHPKMACLAALGMKKRLKELSDKWKEAGRPGFYTRVGLHTGKVIIGNIGTAERFDYSIIGDSVNLASRLEGINKYYESQIIVSGVTYKLCQESIAARELDCISVKGKKEPCSIYELIGRKGEVSEKDLELIRRYDEGLAQYKEGNWVEAVNLFEKLSQEFPNDGPSKILLERCREFQNDPPADWQGVFSFSHK